MQMPYSLIKVEPKAYCSSSLIE